MNRWCAVVMVVVSLALCACAGVPQRPIELARSNIAASGSHIGVAMTAVPKVDTSFPGAGCLLCIAAASVMNSSLTSYAHTISPDDVPKVKGEIADALRQAGADVVLIDVPLDLDKLPNFSSKTPDATKKDFSSLKDRYKIDRLVVIDITQLGFERTFANYVPTSAPKALVAGSGYMVNLATNLLEWYVPLHVLKSADGSWDEPPKYPGLTNAFYQAWETVHDLLTKPFAG